MKLFLQGFRGHRQHGKVERFSAALVAAGAGFAENENFLSNGTRQGALQMQAVSRSAAAGKPIATSSAPNLRPLRIGIMLRAVDDIDGQGVYIRKLCDALFDLDRVNEYVLFYMRGEQLGRYAQVPNAREVLVKAPAKIVWDQLLVPLAARREAVDVLFHHKFSIPLLSPCPAVVQQRGTEYWAFPEFFPGARGWLDRVYNKTMIPLYCRRAVRVLTNSNSLADELTRYAGVPRAKMRTIYAAADESFVPVTDPHVREQVRAKYGLPEEPFFLAVVKGYQIITESSNKIGPRKNVEGVLRAYGQVQQNAAAPLLVVIGPSIAGRLAPEAMRAGVNPDRVYAPGFIDFADMPAIYSMAKALIFPSYYESFGIPLVEAMACGCPVITSDVSACPEVVGDAALTVGPDDVAGLACAMSRILEENGLADELRERGLARAREFSWESSARALLAELTSAVARARRNP